jgi:hypothetical protein
MHQHTKFCSLTTSTYGVMGKNEFSHISIRPLVEKDGSWIEIIRVLCTSVNEYLTHEKVSTWSVQRSDWRTHRMTANGKTISPHFFGKWGVNKGMAIWRVITSSAYTHLDLQSSDIPTPSVHSRGFYDVAHMHGVQGCPILWVWNSTHSFSYIARLVLLFFILECKILSVI